MHVTEGHVRSAQWANQTSDPGLAPPQRAFKLCIVPIPIQAVAHKIGDASSTSTGVAKQWQPKAWASGCSTTGGN